MTAVIDIGRYYSTDQMENITEWKYDNVHSYSDGLHLFVFTSDCYGFTTRKIYCQKVEQLLITLLRCTRKCSFHQDK
jgi:hypothetical protein